MLAEGAVTGFREAEVGVVPGLELPEHPQAPWEASSRVVWAALRDWRGPIPLSWPVYPLHPFVAGDPRSNRTPRPAEVRAGAPVALDVPEPNAAALALVQEKGWRQSFGCARMVRGHAAAVDTSRIFGVTSFEFG